VRTLYDLIASPVTNPFTIDIMTPDVAHAAELGRKLSALPLVSAALSIDSFVPATTSQAVADRRREIAAGSDSRFVRLPARGHARTDPRGGIDGVEKDPAGALQTAGRPPLAAVAGDLGRLANAPDATLVDVDRSLTRFLPKQLDQLRTLLDAQPVALKDILPRSPATGCAGCRARVQLCLARNSGQRGSSPLRRSGAAGRARCRWRRGDHRSDQRHIIGAFRTAAITALVAISIILFVALWGTDVCCAGAAAAVVAAHHAGRGAGSAPLNFANIIALPLLLGVGVSFNIYFVMNWRAGQTSVLVRRRRGRSCSRP